MPDPLRTFYHPRPLDVATGLTLPNLLSEDPADMNFSLEKGFASNKGYLVGGGGDEGRSDRLRKNFLACAYWNAELVTDAEGHVDAHFLAPDGLTEYEIMAVVHEGGKSPDGAGRFGNGQGAFRINKPVMLEPALPRFGNVGDHLRLRAVVHNQSPVAGEAEVTLELDDKAAMTATEGQPADAGRVRRVQLAAGESKVVEFPMEFRHTGPAVWTWRARLTGRRRADMARFRADDDQRRSSHPAPLGNPFRAPADERADNLLARMNPELLEGEDGVIQVSLSTSRLSELRESVDSLLQYPYGCIEQTTSSLMPWLALKDFGDALPQLSRTPEEAEDTVTRGINKILSMQTDSGGLAYWPGDSSRDAHPWGSAYGAVGSRCKRAGYFVPQSQLEQALRVLAQAASVRRETHPRPISRTQRNRPLSGAVRAGAGGQGEAAYYEQFFARRDELCARGSHARCARGCGGQGIGGHDEGVLAPGPREKEAPERWERIRQHGGARWDAPAGVVPVPAARSVHRGKVTHCSTSARAVARGRRRRGTRGRCWRWRPMPATWKKPAHPRPVR